MKGCKILNVKSGSTFKRFLSLRDENDISVEIVDYDFYSQIRNSKGELLATASFQIEDVFGGYLIYTAEDMKEIIKSNRLNETLYMDIAVVVKLTEEVMHTETIRLDVDKGITEV